jgi:hypothetical protein
VKAMFCFGSCELLIEQAHFLCISLHTGERKKKGANDLPACMPCYGFVFFFHPVVSKDW